MPEILGIEVIPSFIHPKQKMLETLHEVARQSDLTPEEIISRDHRANVVYARRVLARKLQAMNYSLPMIGRFMRIHHTSVLNLCRRDGWVGKNK